MATPAFSQVISNTSTSALGENVSSISVGTTFLTTINTNTVSVTV